MKEEKLKSLIKEESNQSVDCGERNVSTSELSDLLCGLIAEWEVEANFLDKPHDSETDRACGRTYKQCAKELRNVLGT